MRVAEVAAVEVAAVEVAAAVNDAGGAHGSAPDCAHPIPPCPPPVRFVLFSDTHSRHARLPPVPDGDGLVHAGDLTTRGSLDDSLTPSGGTPPSRTGTSSSSPATTT